MSRREIHRSGDATSACVAAVAPKARGVAVTDVAASSNPALLGAGFDDARVVSQSVAPPRAAARTSARRACTHFPNLSPVAAAPAANEIVKSEAPEVSKRAPLDGDLIRRRWRSLISRHPPKTLSHVLMDRILAWREQVAESGDINSRSRAILAAALAGKTIGAAKHCQVQDNSNETDPGARSPRPRAPLRVGTGLVREHAGVLHRVTVVPDGFEWQGRIYASLSAVARAITGVRWNGHRFFALDCGAKKAGAPSDRERDAAARRTSRTPSEPPRAGDAT